MEMLDLPCLGSLPLLTRLNLKPAGAEGKDVPRLNPGFFLVNYRASARPCQVLPPGFLNARNPDDLVSDQKLSRSEFLLPLSKRAKCRACSEYPTPAHLGP